MRVGVSGEGKGRANPNPGRSVVTLPYTLNLTSNLLHPTSHLRRGVVILPHLAAHLL